MSAGAPPSPRADPRPPRIRYVPALDGLRGAAVAAVVAFHVGHLEGGYLGVDLFFVLSGYLITSLLLAEGRRVDRIDLPGFWERRARRLLPALGVLLVGVAVYARFAATRSELHGIRWDGIATVFYVANWREVLTGSDYWAMFEAPSPLNHTWSLAIEEQFYLIWPLVFVGLVVWAWRREPSPRRLATATLVTAGVLGAASLVAGFVWEAVSGWNRVYFGTDTRAFALLVGVALAAATARFGPVPPGRRRQVVEGAGIVGALFLAVAWVTFTGGSTVVRNGGLAACSLAAGLVVAAVTQPDPGILARGLSWSPLRRLGLISYGVYLYHWPIIVWLNADRVHLGGWPLVGVQVVVTLVAATASYHLLEQPIRHGYRRRARRATLSFAAGGLVVVTTVVVIATIGYRPVDALRIAGPGTTVAPAPDGRRLMFIGDSVPDFVVSEGITYLRTDPQIAVLKATVPGCSEPPTDLRRYVDGTISDAFTDPCDVGWDGKIRTFRPDDVVLFTTGVAAADYRHDSQWLAPCSAAFHDWGVERMESLAARFNRAGARFVIVTTMPQDRRGRSDDAYRSYLDANACWNATLRDAVTAIGPGALLVDLDARFCAAGTCATETPDGSIAREDGTHFRARAAQIIGKTILAGVGIDATIPR